MTETIEAHAERLAQEREHWDNCLDCGISFEESCTDEEAVNHDVNCREFAAQPKCTEDHRTPAEQRAAALDAAAVLWAWFRDQGWDRSWQVSIANTYAAIQRTEVPQ